MAEVDVEDLLARLVAFDTTSSRSTAEVVAFLAERLDRPGVEVWDLVDPDPPGEAEQHNLLVRLGPAAPDAIVLSAHLDCVPVDGQPWSSDPFAVVRDGDRLVGRGTTDMKGFVAACVAGLADLDTTSLRRPVVLAFSHSEEIGTRGAPHLVGELARRVPDASAAIVGEPTMMRVVSGHKGVGGLEVVLHGVDGHSSQPQLTANTNLAAGRLVARVAELARDREQHGPFDERFEPPHSTFNAGRLHGGSAVNIVPRRTEVLLEARNVPAEDLEAMLDELRRYAEQDVAEELARHVGPERAHVEVRPFGRPVPALATAPGSEAERLARACGAVDEPSSHVAYATDGGHFQLAGIPTVVCGPGSIDQAHRPDEHLDVAQLEAAVAFVRRVGAAAGGQ